MKINYDKEADALYIKLKEGKVFESEEIEDNIIIDYDRQKNILGIEVTYFLAKHKQDFFPVFKKMEQSVWGIENSVS